MPTLAVGMRVLHNDLRFARAEKATKPYVYAGEPIVPQDISIRTTIPFSLPNQQENIEMGFYKWLPINDSDRITVDREDFQCTLRFRKGDLPFSSRDFPEKPFANPKLDKVAVELLLRGVADADALRIKTRPIEKGLDYDAAYASPQKTAGQRAAKIICHYVNRLISYARNHRGQYWLTELPVDEESLEQFFFKYKVEVQTETSDWSRFIPPGVTINGVFELNSNRMICESEWEDVRDFVNSDRNPALVSFLLSEAEALASAGHNKASLVHAVTALDITINEFANNPTNNEHLVETLRDRIHVTSLKKLVSKFGLQGTVSTLLPLIFSEEELPKKLIDECCQAINQRNTVVHNGQRTVNKNDLAVYLRSIRQLRDTLVKQTHSTPNDVESEDITN